MDVELASPGETQERKDSCHPAAVRLQPRSAVSPEDTQDVKIQDTGPKWLRCIIREMFSVSSDSSIFPSIEKC